MRIQALSHKYPPTKQTEPTTRPCTPYPGNLHNEMKKSPDTLNFDGNTAEGTEEEGAGSVPDAPPPKLTPHKPGTTSPQKYGIPIPLISNVSLYD